MCRYLMANDLIYDQMNTLYNNSASTRLRSQTFSIRLDKESPVGTPLRRYLISNGLVFIALAYCYIYASPSIF